MKKNQQKKKEKKPTKTPNRNSPSATDNHCLVQRRKVGKWKPPAPAAMHRTEWVCPWPPARHNPRGTRGAGAGQGAGEAGHGKRGGGAGRGLPDKGGGPHPTTARFPTALDSGRLRCGAVHSVSAASSRPIRCAGERPCLPRKFPLSLSQTHFLLPPPVQTAQSRSRSALFPGVNSDQFSLTLYNNPTPIAISLPL